MCVCVCVFFLFLSGSAPHTHIQCHTAHIRDVMVAVVVQNCVGFALNLIVSAHTTQIYLHKHTEEWVKNIKSVCVYAKKSSRDTQREREREGGDRERQRGAAVAGGKASTNLTVAANALARRWLCWVRVVRIWPQGGLTKRFGLEFQTATEECNSARHQSVCVWVGLSIEEKKRQIKNGGRNMGMVVWTQVDDENREVERERQRPFLALLFFFLSFFPSLSLSLSCDSFSFFFSCVGTFLILFLFFSVCCNSRFSPPLVICSTEPKRTCMFFLYSFSCLVVFAKENKDGRSGWEKCYLVDVAI